MISWPNKVTRLPSRSSERIAKSLCRLSIFFVCGLFFSAHISAGEISRKCQKRFDKLDKYIQTPRHGEAYDGLREAYGKDCASDFEKLMIHRSFGIFAYRYDRDKAIAELQKAEKLNLVEEEKYIEVLRILAQLKWLKNEYYQALSYFDRFKKLKDKITPEDTVFLLSIYYSLHKLDESIKVADTLMAAHAEQNFKLERRWLDKIWRVYFDAEEWESAAKISISQIERYDSERYRNDLHTICSVQPSLAECVQLQENSHSNSGIIEPEAGEQ